MCNKSGMSKEFLSRCKYLAIKEVELKINALRKKNNMLHSVSIKDSLEELHGKFIATQIDKANGNVAANCKRFYAFILIIGLRL